MKTTFAHFKNRAGAVSVRSLALVLCFVMLVTAVSAGTMMTAFAKGRLAEEACITDAAKKVVEIADSVDIPDAEDGLTPALSKKVSDLAETGYGNTCYVKGAWDGWITPDDEKGHKMTGDGYTVSLAANTAYKFVCVADNGDVFKKDTTITSAVDDYDMLHDATADAKIKTTIAGNYTFKFKSWNGDNCMRIQIIYPTGTETTTWTVVGAYGEQGDSPAGFFGSAWAPTATANDMTENNGVWTKTWSNVTLNSETTVYYKVAKNHAWNTAYPTSNNESQTIPAGTYNITITYTETGNTVSLTSASVAKSTLTVGTVNDADVTATYNGTTVNEGGHIDNIPAGAQVTVNVTPIQGKKCTAVTGTYDTSSTVNATSDGTGKVWTMMMPAAATTVSATIENVSLKKIYFNNNYTLYGTVYAYVYDKDGTTETNLYLGKKPGKVMIESENSEIWYIEVPENITYVQFISGEGYTTGEMSIPWTTYTYPKYTAPYGHNDAPNTTNGGTWGNYLYGSDNKRTNEYTVTDGSTMSANNLFTGISATLYDYYTDGEINASAGTASDNGANGSPNGWIKGIANDEYCLTVNGWKWNPYTTLNSALSAYADNSVQPKYDVSKPLYFGNLNVSSRNSTDTDFAINTTGNGNRDDILNYHGWDSKANNSIDLNSTNNAVTGLSGKTLGDDKTIHYYSSSDSTNENGAPMAMFNEDFLSGENNQNKALATILRTSSFPVRKTERYPNIYFDISSTTWWSGSNAKVWAHLWDDANNTNDVLITSWSNNNIATIPATGYTHVKFVRCKNTTSSDSLDWNNIWNQTGNLDIQDNGNVRWEASSDTDGTTSGSWTTQSTAPHHVYYEFDSTNGKDNAYIESIDKSNKTATINYYDASQDKKVHSVSNTNGFFPFNRNDYTPDQNKLDYAQDLGFGMKLEILFNLNNNGLNTDGTHQTFDFSGDDDLWVFIDGKLALDLGGAHGRTTGSIDFNTMTITATNTQSIADGITRNGSISSIVDTSANDFNPNYVHTMTIYYMERGMFDSNLKFGFSFHAIPNMFWVDKKIRTKDKYNLGYDTVNSGFFTDNGKTGDDSNMTTYNGKSISKFERSFQEEEFTVEQKQNSTLINGASYSYTVDNDSQSHTPTNGQYRIYHDLGNCFVGKFNKGDTFNLKEIIGANNKYVYQPVFSVWDQANNDQTVTHTGDNTDGYQFTFAPTTAVTGGIDMLNLKARFDNYMVAHDLTLTKEITNAVDTTTDFTFQIKFDFTGTDGSPNYVAYPLYCDVDGARQQLSNDGTITVKAGQKVVIIDIPENAKIKVEEVYTDTVDGYRFVGVALTNGGQTVSPTSTDARNKSVEFTMGDNDMALTFSNKKPDNRYTIKYNYPGYLSSYGTQFYIVDGVFTADELKTYMQLNASTGALEFKDDTAKKNFINIKAPYEDNFQQTLSFINSTIDDTGEGKGWSNEGNYTCEVTAVAADEHNISVSFKLPYEVDEGLVPHKDDDGKVSKIDALICGTKNVACFDWYVTSGKSRSSASGDDPVFVNAPLIIVDRNNTPTNDADDITYYFNHWSVKKKSNYGMASTEYTRCYDYSFNLAVFMDCEIEPIYARSWAQSNGNPNPPSEYNTYGRYDPELQILAEQNDLGIGVTFLENSRNQYNSGGKGNRTGNDAADVIYMDFLLNYNYANGLGKLSDSVVPKKAGLVIEAVKTLDYDSVNHKYDTNKEYKTENASTEETTKAAIITWLEGGNKAANCAKSEFSVSKLDNKNCIQWYYSLNNRSFDSSSGQLKNTLQNRYKLFRAYAYIGDVSGNHLDRVIVSNPIYFTIYDIGANGLDDNVIGG